MVSAQKPAFGQDLLENTSTTTENRLDTIIELLRAVTARKYYPTIPDHYCFFDGISVCNLWTVYWSGTQTFCLYEETLPDCVLFTYCSYHGYTCAIHS